MIVDFDKRPLDAAIRRFIGESPRGVWTDFVFGYSRRAKVTRIYVVTDKEMNLRGEADDRDRYRLVRAGTPAQAVRHVTKGRLIATKATQDELVGLLSRGVKVEDAEVEEPEG